MDPVLDEFEKVASNVEYSDPKVGFVSNVTGELADARLIGRPEYWRRHAREPVQFAAAVQTLEEQGAKIFLEMGPDPVLLGMARRCLKEGRPIVAAFTPLRTRGLAADAGKLAGTVRCRRRH